MLSPGDRLGRYEVVSPLGAGGMGEVYRARDTELDREVALKVLPDGVASDTQRLRRFEREAKAVAALNHPNVLTVHDVGAHNGTAYLVSELLEGETLREHARKRKVSPTRALEIGLEVARGLEAAHAKDLLHRDIKPENVFVGRDGRVKVLDFGLAKLAESGPAGSEVKTETRGGDEATRSGQVLGTVGYMSPEQARGRPLDARTDVFSLGVVLYELLSGKHPFRRETEIATLSALLEEEPPDPSGSGRGVSPAIAGIVKRCLAKDVDKRYASGRDLVVALEAVLGQPSAPSRLVDAEERSPYPGLSSFSEEDAGRFFGRESEVEALWERLQQRRLLAVIGPSGAGKTSFVRAGVVASRPRGWAALVCTPGVQPLRNLGQALAPEVSADPDALRKLVGLEDSETAFELLVQWRKGYDEALLLLDQFEELFTLNPPAVQEAFVGLLSRLARDGDVHVLLSLRDDFLIRCSDHAGLTPVFEALTPMPLLAGDSLRRAVVEPASREGYRFEDEALVEEILAAGEGARGALPLLAFAASRLWDNRDREKRVLTRAAYEEMGGVAGALAQHAEGVLERIGMVRQSLVREMFRNLVTAQGTRAVVEREELLSVFPERAAAEEVLATLIDARLLTSYEVQDDLRHPARDETGGSLSERDGDGHRAKNLADAGPENASAQTTRHHRIEVIHESLLKAWPRLVMWQAQEEEGAVLRDQLRQAAHLWDEKGRPEELVWTGRAHLEYRAWRSRYSGGLSALEEEFAEAMAAQANRKRRRQRIVAAALLIAVSAVALVTSGLWSRSESARREAQDEARQREAAQLLGLGRLRLAERRSEALAFTIASLERADNEPARRFALEVLWNGPLEHVFGTEEYGGVARFSPDGQWAVTGGMRGAWLWSREGGPTRALLAKRGGAHFWVWAANDGRHVAVGDYVDDVVRLYSVDDGVERGTLPIPQAIWMLWLRDRVITMVGPPEALRAESRPLGGGAPTPLGHWDARSVSLDGGELVLDHAGETLVEARDGVIALRRLDALDRVDRVLGRHDDATLAVFSPSGRVVLSVSPIEIQVWPLNRREPGPSRTLHPPGQGATWGTPHPGIDPTGRFVAAMVRETSQESDIYCAGCTWTLLDLEGPPDHEPLDIVQSWVQAYAFSPSGDWLISPFNRYLSLWFLGGPRSYLIPFPVPTAGPVFSPDGRFVAASAGHELRVFPTRAGVGEEAILHAEPDLALQEGLAYDPRGRFVVATAPFAGTLAVVPLPEGPARHLSIPGMWGLYRPAISPDGTFLAAAYNSPRVDGSARLGVWDLETGERRDLDPRSPEEDCGPGGFLEGYTSTHAFLPDGRLVTGGTTGLRLWDLEAGTSERLRDCIVPYSLSIQPLWLAVTPDGRQIASLALPPEGGNGAPPSRLTVFDLETRKTREITSHGNQLGAMTLDPTGRLVVTQGREGVVRVGPITGEEPQLLVGEAAELMGVSVSPDGSWIATTDPAGIRLWPMPDVTRPPLHTLPLEELLRRLRTHTNLRIVPDPGAESGYRVEPGPFPGWARTPEW